MYISLDQEYVVLSVIDGMNSWAQSGNLPPYVILLSKYKFCETAGGYFSAEG